MSVSLSNFYYFKLIIQVNLFLSPVPLRARMQTSSKLAVLVFRELTAFLEVRIGVVIGTGDKTVFGRIAKLTNEPKTGFTPLEKDVFNFVIIIFSLMTSMIILCVIVW